MERVLGNVLARMTTGDGRGGLGFCFLIAGGEIVGHGRIMGGQQVPWRRRSVEEVFHRNGVHSLAVGLTAWLERLDRETTWFGR